MLLAPPLCYRLEMNISFPGKPIGTLSNANARMYVPEAYYIGTIIISSVLGALCHLGY